MAYQSLYRRYRPQRFGEVVGQEHVTNTLRNAVRDNRVAHAYLFSGPRGTGKTSSARILAKALNCDDLDGGEPCGRCDSCVAITAGSSSDVFELDAASNNGVDAMRELISRAALASPGRSKVYIVDEVHMLTAAASNTLLKTLEEPPPHVVFVLATTDPQKVLPTVRSRTQHFEFRLLPADALLRHLRWVAADAGLDVAPEALELVARRGSGSARDALSALDQVAAAGGIEDEVGPVDELVEALCDRDAGRCLVAVAEACGRGHDPRQLARDLVEHLRNAFLALMARNLVALADDALAHVEDQARRLGAAGVVRGIEVIGEALVEMRDTVDPRIALEVALVRIARPEADTSPAALLERLERLERRLAGHVDAPAVASAREAVAAPPPAVAAARSAVATPPAPAPPTAPGAGRPPAVRPALGAFRRDVPASPTPAATPAPAAAPPPDTAPAAASAPGGEPPSRDELQLAWGDELLARLPNRPRTRLAVGRWLAVEDGVAVYGLPNDIHRQRCEEFRTDVEQVLAAHFGRRVPVRLAVDTGAAPAGSGDPGAPEPDPEPHRIDVTELSDAPPAVASVDEVILQAFPGARPVEE